MKDTVVPILAILASVGLIGAIGAVFFMDVPDEESKVLWLLLGALIGISNQVYGYYFGSSESSAKKTDAMKEALRPPKAGR